MTKILCPPRTFFRKLRTPYTCRICRRHAVLLIVCSLNNTKHRCLQSPAPHVAHAPRYKSVCPPKFKNFMPPPTDFVKPSWQPGFPIGHVLHVVLCATLCCICATHDPTPHLRWCRVVCHQPTSGVTPQNVCPPEHLSIRIYKQLLNGTRHFGA